MLMHCHKDRSKSYCCHWRFV